MGLGPCLLASADFHGNEVVVHNIRNCEYTTAEDYVLRYSTKRRSGSIRSVDFIIVPFADLPQIAHVMLSFGFADDRYVAVSVEIRREKGKVIGRWLASSASTETMYVVADERDVLQLRTIHRLDDVFVPHACHARASAVAVCGHAESRQEGSRRAPSFTTRSQITVRPTSSTTSTSSRPTASPTTCSSVLPGYSDRMAYALGLLDTEKSFEETHVLPRRQPSRLHPPRQPDFRPPSADRCLTGPP